MSFFNSEPDPGGHAPQEEKAGGWAPPAPASRLTASAGVPASAPEPTRLAAACFERASQMLVAGQLHPAIRLLLECCRLDPAGLLARQALRRAEKAWYRDNGRGGRLACLRTWPARRRLSASLRAGQHLAVLEQGELILLRNPWDVTAHRAMAIAAERLGWHELAVWLLEQARQQQPRCVELSRSLALLYERLGRFVQARSLWGFVAREVPDDAQARDRLRSLGEAPSSGSDPGDGGQADACPSGPLPAGEGGRGGGNGAAPPLEELRRRLEQEPTRSDLYLQLADGHLRADQPEEARRVLEDALGATGQAFDVLLRLSELEIEPFRRDLSVAEKLLVDRPEDAGLRHIRAQLRREVLTRELDLYRRKADRFPTQVRYRLEVGERLFHLGQLDEAIEELQAVLRGAPGAIDNEGRTRAFLALGHCFLARRSYQQAQRYFQEALECLPAAQEAARRDILARLADAASQAGDRARSAALTQELARLDALQPAPSCLASPEP